MSDNGVELLRQKIKKIKNTKKPFEEIGRLISENVKLRFNRGVDPYGKPWEPRSAAYVQSLIKQGRLTDKVLVLTKSLQKSISYRTDGKILNIGSNLDYAKAHNRGYDNLPKRQFLGISEKDIRGVDRIIAKHIKKP